MLCLGGVLVWGASTRDGGLPYLRHMLCFRSRGLRRTDAAVAPCGVALGDDRPVVGVASDHLGALLVLVWCSGVAGGCGPWPFWAWQGHQRCRIWRPSAARRRRGRPLECRQRRVAHAFRRGRLQRHRSRITVWFLTPSLKTSQLQKRRPSERRVVRAEPAVRLPPRRSLRRRLKV